MTCDTCAYATEHGSWPPTFRATHCRGCHRSWIGGTECHCTLCHLHFGGVGAFKAHRTFDTCATLEEIAEQTTERGVRRWAITVRKHGQTVIRHDPRSADGIPRKALVWTPK